MNRIIPILFSIICLSTASCTNTGTQGPTVGDTHAGTESGNPRTFGGIPCENDADCQGAFDQQIDDYDAVLRTAQCNPDNHTCRAILVVEDKCYVDQVIDSRAYDCSLTDQEIFELSESESK
jgi:hypothetical protein